VQVPYYKKILKYWKDANQQLEMDVTALKCEEEDQWMQLIDNNGHVVAEFGPGKPYDGWALTVEYSAAR
jgi:hypothetical protein